jgi:hypothetical protein
MTHWYHNDVLNNLNFYSRVSIHFIQGIQCWHMVQRKCRAVHEEMLHLDTMINHATKYVLFKQRHVFSCREALFLTSSMSQDRAVARVIVGPHHSILKVVR